MRSPRPVIVLEVNEVPLRVWRDFAGRRPASTVARLLRNGLALETVARDVDESFLYPSQTWASLNTGAPYDRHRIHWYNDPKPAEVPMYWRRLAAAGTTVGLVSTLHTAPFDDIVDDDHYRFVLPDSFAPEPAAKPSELERFQRFNLQATAANARVATGTVGPSALVDAVKALPTLGLQRSSVATMLGTAAKVALKRENKERLRSLQFPILADLFVRQYRQHRPQLAVLFTNHVAAAMHRYWYAAHPEDFDVACYDDEWVDRYRWEIVDAMELLDRYLARLVDLARADDAVLVVVTSMGQQANTALTPEVAQRPTASRLDDVDRFLAAVAPDLPPYASKPGMVPQYSLSFDTEAAAIAGADALDDVGRRAPNLDLTIDRTGDTVTLTVGLVDDDRPVTVGDARDATRHEAADLGFTVLDIDDHKSGEHSRSGALLVYNSDSVEAPDRSIDYLEYAPAMLTHFGVEPAEYAVEPTFRF